MNYYSKIEDAIFNNIFSERDVVDWKQYKDNVILNFNNINFTESIENYIPCQRKLYITRPKMREILHCRLTQLNDNIFQEVNYDTYAPRQEYDICFKDICDFIEECVKILSRNQQGKN
jgi:hypothetical protein